MLSQEAEEKKTSDTGGEAVNEGAVAMFSLHRQDVRKNCAEYMSNDFL